MKQYSKLFFLIAIAFSSCQDKQPTAEKLTPAPQKIESLKSWNEGEVKTSLTTWIKKVTTSDSPDFIPEEDRIACFDNDGTLWAEQPSYFQLTFAMDNIRSKKELHEEWKETQPFKAILENDVETMKSFTTHDIIKVVMASHGGMTQEEFQEQVTAWNDTSRHSRFDQPYTALVYQPMLELLDLLQKNNFKTYIVSGGGVYFMRSLVSDVYNIPSEQIIGSTIVTNFKNDSSGIRITRSPLLDFVNDKEGKPVNINRIIGKVPVFCAGNSDGDLAMLQYTATNTYNTFNLLVHHTDGEREWAYDRESHIGHLDKAWDEASDKGWAIVDMKSDWKYVFPHEIEPNE